LIYSESYEQHLVHLRSVFEKIRQSKLFCKLKKCEFGKTKIKYLGHEIANGTVSVDPAKTEAISTWPEPSCVKEL